MHTRLVHVQNQSSPPATRGKHRGHALRILEILPGHPGVGGFDKGAPACGLKRWLRKLSGNPFYIRGHRDRGEPHLNYPCSNGQFGAVKQPSAFAKRMYTANGTAESALISGARSATACAARSE
ncbi:MAG TPA: hypothetical protein VIY49_36545 [Bryobacteraceae bacterium]